MISNLPRPLFAEEGRSSLWKREVRRDFTASDVNTIMSPFLFDPVFFHAVNERRPGDAQMLRGPRLVALVPFQGFDDKVLLQVFERDSLVGKVQDDVLDAHFSLLQLVRQLDSGYCFAAPENRGPLDDVLQFTNVARPPV